MPQRGEGGALPLRDGDAALFKQVGIFETQRQDFAQICQQLLEGLAFCHQPDLVTVGCESRQLVLVALFFAIVVFDGDREGLFQIGHILSLSSNSSPPLQTANRYSEYCRFAASSKSSGRRYSQTLSIRPGNTWLVRPPSVSTVPMLTSGSPRMIASSVRSTTRSGGIIGMPMRW